MAMRRLVVGTDRRKNVEQSLIGNEIVEIDLDGLIDWVETHLSPEEVFEQEELDEWAAENGWERPAPAEAERE